jgi:hypothetical protein
MSEDASEHQVNDYVRRNAPELDVDDVVAFLNQRDKPADEKGFRVEWAVRALRERRAAEREGPSIDRVADAMRRRDAR